jgi:hypothetical protein
MVAASGSGHGMSLLVWCEPWLLALPIAAVRRIAASDEVVTLAGAAAGDGAQAWLGTIGVGTARLPAWDLAGLLSLPATAAGAWVVVDRPRAAALRVGRCLQVVDLARRRLRPLPPGSGGPSGARSFAADGLAIGLDPAPAFGLLLAPERLLPAAAVAG